MPHLPKWTYGLVAAGSPVAGFPLWQAVLGFHIAAWIAQVPLSLSNVKGCCFNHYFKPLNLAPLFQFIGHGVFEGRAPALLDSWDQVIFIVAFIFKHI